MIRSRFSASLLLAITLFTEISYIGGYANIPISCQMQASKGHCRALTRKYYYNIETDNCEYFTYGGCAGNANRFNTKEECEYFCQRSRVRY